MGTLIPACAVAGSLTCECLSCSGPWTWTRMCSRRPDGKRVGSRWTTSRLARGRRRMFFAVGNQCTHQGAGLDKGVVKIAGSVKTVTCPAHGSTFNLETGQGHAAAGHEARARLRREGRGRPRLRSAARRDLELLDRAGFHPRTVRGRGDVARFEQHAGRGLAGLGTAPGAPASARRCRAPLVPEPIRRCPAGGSRRPRPRRDRRTTAASPPPTSTGRFPASPPAGVELRRTARRRAPRATPPAHTRLGPPPRGVAPPPTGGTGSTEARPPSRDPGEA